jgi:zinc and cadmium transporter
MVTIIILWCVLVAAVSFAGGELPSYWRLTHAWLQVIVSFVAGLMLGVGLFHMLPHAAIEVESLDLVMLWVMGGLLTTFFLIRTFHFHQHGSAEKEGTGFPHVHEDEHRHSDEHSHDVVSSLAVATAASGRHRFGWLGMGLGLSIHTLADGAALAASVQADAHIAPDSSLPGIGIFFAVFGHKWLDAMSITSLMAATGRSRKERKWVNVVYSLMCPLGAFVYWNGTKWFAGGNPAITGCALAFTAGVFLCISLSDLLPEVQFHSHDRLTLSAALLLGVSIAWSLRFVEGPHAHRKTAGAPRVSAAE